MTKPILFHDIDGVLYGTYGGEFQLRPGVKTWLEWASARFEIVWLTTWDEDKIKTLLSVVSCEKYLKDLVQPTGLRRADWETAGDKSVWLATQSRLKNMEWVWIDDNMPEERELSLLGLDPACCLAVNPDGMDALEDLRFRLSDRLFQRASSIPQSTAPEEPSSSKQQLAWE